MRNRGFTFIEILVALAIVSIGVIVLAKMQILSIRGTGFNRATTTATAIAQGIIEDCRAAGFGVRPASCDKQEPGMKIECQMSISGNAPYRSNSIAVRVTWGTPQNQVVLSTAVAER